MRYRLMWSPPCHLGSTFCSTIAFYRVSCNWTPRWYCCVVHQMFATPRNRTRSITTNCGTRVSPDAVFPMVFGDLGNWEHLLNPAARPDLCHARRYRSMWSPPCDLESTFCSTIGFYRVSCNWTPRWYFCVVHQMFATQPAQQRGSSKCSQFPK